jgi:hypothetical protein
MSSVLDDTDERSMGSCSRIHFCAREFTPAPFEWALSVVGLRFSVTKNLTGATEITLKACPSVMKSPKGFSDRAAGDGCCVSSCSFSSSFLRKLVLTLIVVILGGGYVALLFWMALREHHEASMVESTNLVSSVDGVGGPASPSGFQVLSMNMRIRNSPMKPMHHPLTLLRSEVPES